MYLDKNSFSKSVSCNAEPYPDFAIEQEEKKFRKILHENSFAKKLPLS